MSHIRKLQLVAGIAAGSLMATSALAQAEGQALEEVVITGSRLIQNGNAAPTPVTVASTEELQKAAPSSLPDALAQLPQFAGSETGRNAPINGSALNQHGNTLALRNLGPIRTLILLDGRRMPPSRFAGTVDLNTLPEALVKRVEVVTGGASAVYGSDAVSGVVNYILDNDYVGLKLSGQAGVSDEADGHFYKVGVKGGWKGMDDRAHFIFSAEHAQQDPVWKHNRDPDGNLSQFSNWGASNLASPTTAGTASNPLTVYRNVFSATFNENGHLTGGPANFNGQNFSNLAVSADGLTVTPYNTGTPTGLGTVIGGSGRALGSRGQIITGTITDQLYGKFRYQVTDDIEAFASATYARSSARIVGTGTAMSGYRIFSGNAFLPAQLQAAMTANNTPFVTLSKYNNEMQPLVSGETVEALTGTIGLSGKIFTDWTFDLYYTRGDVTTDTFSRDNLENAKAQAAVDAVRDPASGQIVCRVALTNPGLYPGCVPFNPFGHSTESLAAYNYVTDDSVYSAKNKTNDVAATVQGEVFQLPAGPLAISVGGQYRTGSLNLVSNSDPSVPVDPTRILRGAPNGIATRFFTINQGTANGSVKVWEYFGEANVPLLADLPGIQNLDLSLAGRRTHYSTSGWVSTYKVGLSWRPVEDIRFRGTLSRDIRAPSLFELFAGRTAANVTQLDPHIGNVNVILQNVGGGNPSLQPEKGKTYALGVVFTPTFLPGFSASVDFYDIKIKGAINQSSLLNILLDCEASNGTAPSCGLITRPGPFSDRSRDNAATSIRNTPINTAFLANRGVDIDASYRTDLSSISEGLDGALVVRAVVNYVDRFATQADSVSPVLELAGKTETLSNLFSPIPKWRGNLSANYTLGGFDLFAQARYTGKLKGGPRFVYDRHLKPQVYFDMTAAYQAEMWGNETRFFATINNVFDKKLPLWPFVGQATGSDFPSIVKVYDTMGRYFTVGASVSF